MAETSPFSAKNVHRAFYLGERVLAGATVRGRFFSKKHHKKNIGLQIQIAHKTGIQIAHLSRPHTINSTQEMEETTTMRNVGACQRNPTMLDSPQSVRQSTER